MTDDDWFKKPLDARLSDAIVNGIDKHIVTDVKELQFTTDIEPLQIIEGPLLDAMGIVGDLFGSGKMFLPQVLSKYSYKSIHAIYQSANFFMKVKNCVNYF